MLRDGWLISKRAAVPPRLALLPPVQPQVLLWWAPRTTCPEGVALRGSGACRGDRPVADYVGVSLHKYLA